MNTILTENISVKTREDGFFISHTSEDGTIHEVCYSEKTQQRIGLLNQILRARSWFVCTSTVDVLNDYKNFKGTQRDTLKIIKDLNTALLHLGGEEYDRNINFSDNFLKEIKIDHQGERYICQCDIKWHLEFHEQERPSLVYTPKFSWYSEKAQGNNQYTNMPLFKKTIEFDSLYSEDWVKILNGRDFHKFLQDMIKKYNNK